MQHLFRTLWEKKILKLPKAAQKKSPSAKKKKKVVSFNLMSNIFKIIYKTIEA